MKMSLTLFLQNAKFYNSMGKPIQIEKVDVIIEYYEASDEFIKCVSLTFVFRVDNLTLIGT